MKLISTDVVALTCIAGCATVAVAGTAAFLDGSQPQRASEPSPSIDCLVEFQRPVNGISISPSGEVSVEMGDLRVSSQAACPSIEDRRKRRRRRHPHTHDAHRQIRFQAVHAQDRAFTLRTRALERRERVEAAAVERRLNTLQTALDREIEANLDEELQLLEERLQRALEGSGR